MILSRRKAILGSLAVISGACSRPGALAGTAFDAGVTFEAFDDRFSVLVNEAAPARLLGTGHWWAEGPAWDKERQKLYFTDVPRNRAYSWSPTQGQQIFLNPSGVPAEQTAKMREPGANGLLLARSGEMLICNHGARAVEARNFTTGERRVLAARFEGKRFNSPNDIIEAKDGTIYFTDPPYGLEGLDASPLKEMAVNGVYRLAPDGKIDRVVEDMTFPNGVALSPDERWLYVSQSDGKAPLIRRFALADGGISTIEGGDIWFDAKPFLHDTGGLPDGMAISEDGDVFLAGPGGVLVIDPNGKCLGRIGTGRASANCAFGEDGKTLFITAKDRLVAVSTKVRGLGQF